MRQVREETEVADLVGTRLLRFVNHARVGVGDEPESSGALRAGILHDHHVHDVAPFLKVTLQVLVGGAVIQPTDEQFAHMLRLSDGVLEKNRKLLIFSIHQTT